MEKKGEYKLKITYAVQGQSDQAGVVVSLPTVGQARTALTASLPGEDIEVAVIPALGLRTTSNSGRTEVQAEVPAGIGLQLSWRSPVRTGFALSRAHYRGELQAEAIAFVAEIHAETFANQVELPIIPLGVTLSDLTINGTPSTVLLSDKHFATVIKKKGRHRIRMAFEVPIERTEGRPHVNLMMRPIPISRFELTLPGRKEVVAEPKSNVRAKFTKKQTLVSVNAPMSDRLTLSWAEAIPETVREEIRANAVVVHAVQAEEGVLLGRAFVFYEVTRGKNQPNRAGDPKCGRGERSPR